jgi:membrane protease YdiL (CAAX protease family)
VDAHPPGPTEGEPVATPPSLAEPPGPPSPGPPAPGAGTPPPFHKSGLLFFGTLVLLFGPGLVAQALHPAAGLAWSEAFVFLLPSVAAAIGSNLRPVRYLGLTRPAGVHLGLAALVGGAGFLVANAVMALWVRALPEGWTDRFDVGRLFDAPLGERIAIALVASLLAPLCEEVAFRGYLQRTLAIRRGPVVAVGASALLFAVLHVDPVRFPALILLGLVFGWLAWRSGSTWTSMVAHAVNNGLASSFALAAGRPDPGAELPPAGDIARALAAGTVALALLLRAYRNATPVPPVPTAAVALRDPGDPSVRFRLARLPQSLWAAVSLGITLLATMALLVSLTGGRHPRPATPLPPPTAPGPVR